MLMSDHNFQAIVDNYHKTVAIALLLFHVKNIWPDRLCLLNSLHQDGDDHLISIKPDSKSALFVDKTYVWF